MKKKILLTLLNVLLCAATFAAEGHKCGLKAENISVEGPRINHYSLNLKFTMTNPTDTVAYTDDLLLYHEYINKEGEKGYIFVNYFALGGEAYPDIVSLQPGESKDFELILYGVYSPTDIYKICISGSYESGNSADGYFIDELGRIEVNMEEEWRPLDITGTLELDNISTDGSQTGFYGNNLTGKVTLTNNEPNPIFAYYSTDQHISLLLQQDNGNGKFKKVRSIPVFESIDAGETVTADFTMEGMLEDGKNYMLVVEYGYSLNNMQAAAADTLYFTAHNTPTYWRNDGRAMAFSSVDGKTYKVPADAVNFEILGADAKIDISEASPNCLYYLSEDATVPAEIAGKNVVKGNKAENITVIDGYGFYCPARFMAANAFYTRLQTVDNIEGGGWEPLALPFDTDGMELTDINGIHTDGNVTVKELASVNGDVLEFSEVNGESLKAEKPYIIKSDIPESHIMFHGANKSFRPKAPEVQAGNYKFTGNFSRDCISSAYVINSNGTAFELADNVEAVPFRGYIVAEEGTTEYPRLYIDRVNTDAISSVTAGDFKTDNNVYTISGVEINAGNTLPRGLYIKNGKKIAVR